MQSSRKTAFLACRILSLFVAYQAVQQVGLAVIPLVQAIRADLALTLPDLFDLFYPYLFVTVYDLLAFLFFWCGANWISGRLAGHREDEGQRDDWSRSGILSLAVTVLGLVILITTVPKVAGFLYLVTSQDQAAQSYLSLNNLIQFLVATGLGIGCLLGPRAIADIIVRLRRW